MAKKHKVINTFSYKGRMGAEIENGNFFLTAGSMYLIYCEKVEDGYKVIKDDIVAGMMIRDFDDFKSCVESCDVV